MGVKGARLFCGGVAAFFNIFLFRNEEMMHSLRNAPWLVSFFTYLYIIFLLVFGPSHQFTGGCARGGGRARFIIAASQIEEE